MKKLLNNISEWTPRLSWAWRQLFAVVLPLALAFGLAMGCYKLFGLLFEGFAAEPSQAVLYEVLTIVLAIAAIGIAAFGVGAYRLLSATIERKVNEGAEIARVKALVVQAIDNGWLYWNLYLVSEGKPKTARTPHLESAIFETRKAHDLILQHLDISKHEVKHLLAIAKNNWAFYIYEKDFTLPGVSQAEKALALGFIDDLEQQRFLFPELTAEFIRTIEKVAGRFRPATS